MRALLSVSDKTNLLDFARTLYYYYNVELIASGGTARFLQQAGLPVTSVEQLTGLPEMLDGRVKTLHPMIFAGILARDTADDRADLARMNAQMIDLVVVNLYPFQKTVAQRFVTLRDAIEHIDIGGVALLRAAAKNYERVTVVCDPCDYGLVLNDLARYGSVSLETREVLALKAFAHTAAYDAAIRDYLMGLQSVDAPILTLTLYKVQELRYGENPHQQAVLFSLSRNGCAGPLGGQLLQGKPLSYNNLLDLDAAWRAVNQFEQPAIVIVKHLSPCGIACAETLHDAYAAALACDPVSAFGSVIAANRPIDAAMVEALGDLFVECIIAPAFTEEARAQLARRKNCRLLRAEWVPNGMTYEYRSIIGGMLRQTVDQGDPHCTKWQVVTQVQPSEADMRALRFAWKACQYVHSNAIVIAREAGSTLATVGIGGGQPNRVDSVRLATMRAGERARGAVMASDAFFPFPDGVEEAAKAGVRAIIQPGGAQRDAEVIAAADRAGLAMVFTGVRHFRH
jgi:phosphoribosylaminoimidazolecarboxamide formyltransferase/IMP cyclohydrolase